MLSNRVRLAVYSGCIIVAGFLDQEHIAGLDPDIAEGGGAESVAFGHDGERVVRSDLVRLHDVAGVMLMHQRWIARAQRWYQGRLG